MKTSKELNVSKETNSLNKTKTEFTKEDFEEELVRTETQEHEILLSRMHTV